MPWGLTADIGHPGVATCAPSADDAALWDLAAGLLDVPLGRFLDRARASSARSSATTSRSSSTPTAATTSAPLSAPAAGTTTSA